MARPTRHHHGAARRGSSSSELQEGGKSQRGRREPGEASLGGPAREDSHRELGTASSPGDRRLHSPAMPCTRAASGPGLRCQQRLCAQLPGHHPIATRWPAPRLLLFFLEDGDAQVPGFHGSLCPQRLPHSHRATARSQKAFPWPRSWTATK